jgi:hypothetical protein
MLQLQQRPHTESPSPSDAPPREEWHTYLPSPEEIENRCREIRRNWSESEHRRRAGLGAKRLRLAILPCRTSLPSLTERHPRDFEFLS